MGGKDLEGFPHPGLASAVNGWHAAAFLEAVHGRRSVPPFALLNFILILLLQFSRTPLCCSYYPNLYAKTFLKLMYFGEHQQQPSLVFCLIASAASFLPILYIFIPFSFSGSPKVK